MRENDIRAIVEILEEIEHDEILYPGFERLLYNYAYPDIKSLRRTFQKICDIIDEWDRPIVPIGLTQEIQGCMLNIEKEPRMAKQNFKLVVADCYQTFMNWCNRCDLYSNNYRYIPNLDHIRGYRDCKMLLLSGFTSQQDYLEIREYCHSHDIERIAI